MIAKNLPELHVLVGERDKFICQLQTSPECKRDYSDSYYFNGLSFWYPKLHGFAQ